MPSVHMHNFESISVTEDFDDTPTKPCQLCKQNYVHMRVLIMHTLTQLLVALKNCKWGFTFIPPCHWRMDKSKHFTKGGRN